MPGQMKQGRQMGQAMSGRLTKTERRFLQDMKGSLSEGDRRLAEELLRQTTPGIRGMNSQKRIDMLKQPKFRK